MHNHFFSLILLIINSKLQKMKKILFLLLAMLLVSIVTHASFPVTESSIPVIETSITQPDSDNNYVETTVDFRYDCFGKLYGTAVEDTDGNCYEFTDLLKVILEDNSIKKSLIKDCANLEKELYDNDIDQGILNSMDIQDLVDTE